MKKIIALLLAIGILLGVFPAASAAEGTNETRYTYENSFIYTIDSIWGITIVDYLDEIPAELTIPAEINGVRVKSIKNRAFQNCTQLKKVHLPEGLLEIGEWAFANTSLTGIVEIPSTVYTLRDSAFEGNAILGYRYLGKPLSIGREAELRIVIMTQAWFEEIGYSMGRAGYDRIFLTEDEAVPDFMEGHVSVVDGISYLVAGQYAYLLRGVDRETVSLPDQVEGKPVRWIMDHAFSTCRNLKNLTLPAQLERIRRSAFELTGLQALTLPASCKRLDTHCFYCTKDLKTVDLSHVEYMGDTVFWDSGLQSVQMSSHMDHLGSMAFSGTELRTGVIPEGVTEVDSTFANCLNLSSVSLPEGLIKVDGVVYGCPLMTELRLPASVTEINRLAQENGLTRIEVPGAVRTLHEYAFRGPQLQSITLNEGLETIEAAAFTGCSSLTELRLPASVQLVQDVPDIDNLYVYFHPQTRFELSTEEKPSIHYINVETGEEVVVNKRVSENGMSFMLRVDHAELLSVSSQADVLEIPAEIQGYPVTVIEKDAIKNLPCSRLLLPDTVTLIRPLAIIGCRNLYCVALPESLSAVEDETGKTGTAFGAPGGLGGNYIVKAGTWAEEYANSEWHGDPGMIQNNVYVYENENPYLAYGNHVFRVEDGEAALVRAFWGEGDPDTDRVPSSVCDFPVTRVCTGAYRFACSHFEDCIYRRIIFQPNLRTIEDGLFAANQRAKEIYIPDTVTEIGDNAFTDQADTLFGNPGLLAESYAAAHGDIFKLVKLPFVDVPEGKWYYDPIRYCYQLKYMSGVSEDHFDPKGTVTRAMLVQVLYQIANGRMQTPLPDDYTAPFTDVAPGKWYSESIRWASYYRFIAGTSETTFSPKKPITREQVAAILYQFARGAGMDHGERAELDAFSDNGTISNYARDAVRWAVAVNMISGYPEGTLGPKGKVKRNELAAMIMHFAELLHANN